MKTDPLDTKITQKRFHNCGQQKTFFFKNVDIFQLKVRFLWLLKFRKTRVLKSLDIRKNSSTSASLEKDK